MKYFFKHLCVINRHKFEVFKLCCKCGFPLRGLLHDLSKYSYTEFSESLKYIKLSNGKCSPLFMSKKDKGYSEAWLHHFGRNKHHYEYWYDPCAPIKSPIIPFKYMVEMICDRIAASKVYNKGNYDNSMPYNHFINDKSTFILNENLRGFLEEVFFKLKEDGEKVLNKKKLFKLYSKYVKKES